MYVYEIVLDYQHRLTTKIIKALDTFEETNKGCHVSSDPLIKYFFRTCFCIQRD